MWFEMEYSGKKIWVGHGVVGGSEMLYLPVFRLAFVLLFCVGTKAGVANMHIAALFKLAQAPVVSDTHQFASGGINAGLCAFGLCAKFPVKQQDR